jgi:glycine/D-amino acid oxidase-like deaminating enzyme
MVENLDVATPTVIIIGTGFGGLCMAIQLKKAGIDSFTMLEKAAGYPATAQVKRSVWESGCTSWYRTASGRNTDNRPGFTFRYRLMTGKLDLNDYELHPTPNRVVQCDLARAGPETPGFKGQADASHSPSGSAPSPRRESPPRRNP